MIIHLKKKNDIIKYDLRMKQSRYYLIYNFHVLLE